MRIRLVHEFRFEAAHRLPKVPLEHKCARMHGHSFKVDIAVAGEVDPETGWLLDFARIYDLWLPLYKQLDHNTLNDLAGLENPTSEVLSKWIWDRVKPQLPELDQVTLWETSEARAEYRGD